MRDDYGSATTPLWLIAGQALGVGMMGGGAFYLFLLITESDCELDPHLAECAIEAHEINPTMELDP